MPFKKCLLKNDEKWSWSYITGFRLYDNFIQNLGMLTLRIFALNIFPSRALINRAVIHDHSAPVITLSPPPRTTHEQLQFCHHHPRSLTTSHNFAATTHDLPLFQYRHTLYWKMNSFKVTFQRRCIDW